MSEMVDVAVLASNDYDLPGDALIQVPRPPSALMQIFIGYSRSERQCELDLAKDFADALVELSDRDYSVFCDAKAWAEHAFDKLRDQINSREVVIAVVSTATVFIEYHNLEKTYFISDAILHNGADPGNHPPAASASAIAAYVELGLAVIAPDINGIPQFITATSRRGSQENHCSTSKKTKRTSTTSKIRQIVARKLQNPVDAHASTGGAKAVKQGTRARNTNRKDQLFLPDDPKNRSSDIPARTPRLDSFDASGLRKPLTLGDAHASGILHNLIQNLDCHCVSCSLLPDGCSDDPDKMVKLPNHHFSLMLSPVSRSIYCFQSR